MDIDEPKPAEEQVEEELDDAVLVEEEIQAEDLDNEFLQQAEGLLTPPKTTGLSVDIINAAYENLYEKARTLWVSRFEQMRRKEWLLDLKAKLEVEKAKALSDGRNDGKNEDARKAKARELFPDIYQSIDSLETSIFSAEVDDLGLNETAFHIAELEIERIHDVQKFLEMMQMAGMVETAQHQVEEEKARPSILVAKKVQ